MSKQTSKSVAARDGTSAASHQGTDQGLPPQTALTTDAYEAEVAEYRERLDILIEENDRLNLRVAVLARNHPMADEEERVAAEAMIQDLQRSLRTLQATNQALKAVQGLHFNEKNALVRQCEAYRRALKRLGAEDAAMQASNKRATRPDEHSQTGRR